MNVNIAQVLKKYTMAIALVVIVIFFQVKTGGNILLPQNVNNLISQNAYVFVLAAGMLLCILTGGNIDLAVGSVVCFVGGIGAVMMNKDINRKSLLNQFGFVIIPDMTVYISPTEDNDQWPKENTEVYIWKSK